MLAVNTDNGCRAGYKFTTQRQNKIDTIVQEEFIMPNDYDQKVLESILDSLVAKTS